MPLTIVLSVGFDPALLMTRVLVLQSAGYLVEQASSVTKAIDLFQAGDFNLVLLCHSVPRKDRDRLTSLIRDPGSRTPIVLGVHRWGTRAVSVTGNTDLAAGPSRHGS
jgi:DNA-binding response OmpR family regulator